uniref:Alternative protein CLGN n=1 Tax=Homo sapiens TaxID=9606 RepID=L8E7N0_HUMAN|nr:alternative protein CLGN [Homo sapiens]
MMNQNLSLILMLKNLMTGMKTRMENGRHLRFLIQHVGLGVVSGNLP